MTPKQLSRKAMDQQVRQKAALKILGGSNHGQIDHNGKKISVKMLPSGLIVGEGKNSGFRLDPLKLLPGDPAR
jgi:hypothetical protein